MISSRDPVILVLLIIVIFVAAGWLVASINIWKPTPSSSPVTSIESTPTIASAPTIPIPSSGYWIKIDPISDKQTGDVFTITATTNLSVGDDILIEVYSPPPMMVAKSASNDKFSGAQGTTKVISGNNGNNTISFIVNTSEFYPIPDEYIVVEMSKNRTVWGTTLFNIYPKTTP